MYQYIHQRNPLCSKILSINGYKQLLTRSLAQKRETEKILGDGSYPPVKEPDILSKKLLPVVDFGRS